MWIIGSVLAIILIAVVGVFIFNKKSSAPIVSSPQEEEEQIFTLKPEDIGLIFSLRPDKKAVKFGIEKARDISRVEYQIAYTKQVTGEEVPEGLIGEIINSDESTSLSTSYRELGTCSSKVCRFDVVVSDVRLILKVTKTDSKVYQVEDSLSLK